MPTDEQTCDDWLDEALKADKRQLGKILRAHPEWVEIYCSGPGEFLRPWFNECLKAAADA